MTSDTALSELIAWVEYSSTFYPLVNGWTMAKAGDDTVKTFPRLVFESTGADEHDVLRGVYDPLNVTVSLQSIPAERGEVDEGTTIEEHEAMNGSLYNIIADHAAVQWIDARGNIRCWDIRGSEGILETEDDLRVTTLDIRITCSQTY